MFMGFSLMSITWQSVGEKINLKRSFRGGSQLVKMTDVSYEGAKSILDHVGEGVK